jgi:hypothetical protein
MKCNICNRESIKGKPVYLQMGEQKIEIQTYSPNIMTMIDGVHICDDCMDTYNKIHALMSGLTFSCAGKHYFADGRNLKDEPYTEKEFEEKVYYTVEPVFTTVSEDEFNKFIENYPNKLEGDVLGACEPPLATYNDFSIATHWPKSIVAKYDKGEPNEYYGLDYKRTYQIMSNYKEVLASIVQE